MSLSWRFGVLLAVALASFGCGSKGGKKAPVDKAAAAEEAKKAEDLKKEEDSVLARRGELQRERKKLSADRVALVEKRKQVAAAGGDVAAIDKEESDLVEREQQLVDQESSLLTKYDELVSRYEAAVASGGQGGAEDATRREAGVVVREKDFARREKEVADRERDIAVREKALAQREKETCGVGATTTIVQQVEPPKGSRYTKRDVEPVLKMARRKMAEKGLLGADLPAQAQALEKEATVAMAEGEYGKAKFAADQLYATVDAMKVDKAFVSAKIGRLNAAMKGQQLTPEQRQLFEGATSDIGDGKFAQANAKLNKIYASLR